MPYCFGSFRLDLDHAILWQGEAQLTLRPKTFDLLAHLVRRAGELVTKDELLEAVWQDMAVSDSALTASMSELRRVLGETAKEPHYIATVYRRGYRFIAPVTAEASALTEAPASISHPPPPIDLRPPATIVAREDELAQLHERFSQALQGQRQVIFITGEAGIGKTTLVYAWLESLAAEEDLWIGQGQCIKHFGVSEAYLPLLEALGRLCRSPEGMHIVPFLEQYAPMWALQLPSVLKPIQIEALQRQVAGVARARMLRELAEALEALTQGQLLVLVLEDLQWADPSTVARYGHGV